MTTARHGVGGDRLRVAIGAGVGGDGLFRLAEAGDGPMGSAAWAFMLGHDLVKRAAGFQPGRHARLRTGIRSQDISILALWARHRLRHRRPAGGNLQLMAESHEGGGALPLLRLEIGDGPAQQGQGDEQTVPPDRAADGIGFHVFSSMNCLFVTLQLPRRFPRRSLPVTPHPGESLLPSLAQSTPSFGAAKTDFQSRLKDRDRYGAD